MENFYEILEVDKKASKEIIEKAYKVLAKKYHPDMNDENNKEEAEEKFKQISQAYEVLSNKEKREEFDSILNKEQDLKYQELIDKIEILEKRLSYYENGENLQKQESNESINYNKGFANNYNNLNNYSSNNQQYTSNYYNNYTYKNKKEPFFKRIFKNLISIIFAILIVIAIGAGLWFIPPTRQWLQSIYNQNPVIKTIVDIFI